MTGGIFKMAKVIDLRENVASICDAYPEVVDVLVELGFTPLADPEHRKVMGTLVTIPDAARRHSIPLETILDALEKNGFAFTGAESI